MKTKHTPGPWGDLTMFGNNLTIGIDWPEDDERDHYLCEVTSGDPEELQGNAQLIRAAPELFKALQNYQLLIDYLRRTTNPEDWGRTGDWERLHREAAIAINKAGG